MAEHAISVVPMRVLITGATRGLGRATARTLATRGARVVVNGRNPHAVTEVSEEICGEPLVLDLADVAAAQRVGSELSELDAVVANAGLQFAAEPTFTQEGLEQTLAVNVLGHVALLDELMAQPAPPKLVVMLGSSTHVPGILGPRMPAPVEDLDLPAFARGEVSPTSGFVRYATTKLYMTALTGAYAREFPETRWLCYDPGLMTDTGLVRDRPAWMQWAYRAVGRPLTRLLPIAITSQRSGEVLASLVANPPGPSGIVYDYRRIFGDRSARAADPKFQDEVLAQSRALAAATHPTPHV